MKIAVFVLAVAFCGLGKADDATTKAATDVAKAAVAAVAGATTPSSPSATPPASPPAAPPASAPVATPASPPASGLLGLPPPPAPTGGITSIFEIGKEINKAISDTSKNWWNTMQGK